MEQNPLTKKLLASILLGIASVGITFLIAIFNQSLERGVRRSPLNAINNEINDIAFQNRRFSRQDSVFQLDDLIIIDIDDASIRELGRVQLWPRSYEASVISYLAKGEPAAIAVDAIYSEPDTLSSVYAELLRQNGVAQPERILSYLSTDQLFTNALQEAGNVYLTVFDDEIPSEDAPPDSILALLPTVMSSPNTAEALTQLIHPVLPYGPFLASAKGVGTISLPSESDGVVRRYPLLQQLPEHWFTSDTLAHLMGNIVLPMRVDQLAAAPGCVTYSQTGIDLCGKQQIPVNRDGQYRINWLGSEESFRTISFYKVLRQRIPADYFRDKFIFIGASAAGLQDNKTTPLPGKIPGVVVHATVFFNLLNGAFLSEPGYYQLWPFLLISAILFAALFISMKPLYAFFAMLALTLAELLSYWLYLFDTFSLILPVGSFFLLTLLTFIVGVLYRYVTEERQKLKLKGAFATYVPPDIVDKVLEDTNVLQLGGEKKVLTVLFSDIRGFTTFSEKMDPQELVAFLNDYLSRMSDIIFEYKGTIDKFIGDAIMAIYGAPVSQEDNANRACLTALGMVEGIKAINAENKDENRKPLAVGIGINTGEMTVGNIGSKRRFDYTVIGDSVNLAARLEGLNKYFKTKILVAEDTYAAAGDGLFVFREVGPIAVKGKDKPVTVYELLDHFKNRDRWEELLTTYGRAMKLYREHKFRKAAESFQSVLEMKKEDGPAEFYYHRCREYIDNPDAFSEVVTMDVK